MKSYEIVCFSHLPSFFNFSTGKRVKKPQGTHILDRLEILYRMVQDLGKNFLTLFLLCVHLTSVAQYLAVLMIYRF
jgi:hypothetical protein